VAWILVSTAYSLPHLRTLEAEVDHVIREVAAEFERPGEGGLPADVGCAAPRG
jgi:hypothetical protein